MRPWHKTHGSLAPHAPPQNKRFPAPWLPPAKPHAPLQIKTIIFASTCKQVRFLFEAFRKLRPGVPLRALHGKMNQYKRMGGGWVRDVLLVCAWGLRWVGASGHSTAEHSHICLAHSSLPAPPRPGAPHHSVS